MCAANKRQENRLWPLEILAHDDTLTEKQDRSINNNNNIVRNESRENTNSRARSLRRKAACDLGNRGLTVDRTDASQAATCGVYRGRECLFIRVSSTRASPERARVERCLTRKDAGSFVRPAWRWASAGGRANGCAPASRLSRLHTRFTARRAVVQPLGRSLGGYVQ